MTSPASPKSLSTDRVVAIGYGVACHLLFGLGVGTMIAAMFFGMDRSLGTVAAPWSLLVNALLLLQFPCLHSLLLLPVGARIMKRLAPQALAGRMATTTYATIASLQVFALFAFWTPSGTVWWQAEGWMLWPVAGLYAIAWLLLLKAIWDAGLAVQTGFLGWWAIANERKPVFPPMPVTGLFRLVRQPIYVAFALTLWTVPVWTPDQLAVALVLTGYCLFGPLLKERRFRQRFGEDFAAYAARIPYWLPWPRRLGGGNDLSIYDAGDWWSGKRRWHRALQNLVPARFAYFDGKVAGWRGKAVLDLGCGGGLMAEALATRGAVVTAIDPSEAAIGGARRHAAASGLAIAYDVGRGESLPYAGQSFDIVVCVDVLEHVADLDRVLAQACRVLRPGGLFLFDTINRTALASFVMVTLGERLLHILPRGTHDPALFIRPAELAARLAAAGFEVEGFSGLGPRRFNRRLDPVFGAMPTLAVQYLGAARVVQ